MAMVQAHTMDALHNWAAQLAAWAIPEPILARATESPWVLPQQVFVRRAQRQVAEPGGPTYRMAAAALADPGTVLDVGAGAGAASLPLAPRTGYATAVDENEAMLARYAERAAALDLPVRLVCGRWPDVADLVEPADLVVCAHVLYNVPDIGPFVTELTRHARRRVVVELNGRHPLVSLNPLWLHFHGLQRPAGPTAEDAVAALHQLGLQPEVHRWTRPAAPDYASFEELVEVTRRRLCLPPESAPDVAAALRELEVDPAHPPDLGSSGRHVVTLTWPGIA
jgi:SAM-dependent methyltransferase